MHQNGKLNLYSQVFKDAVLREVREQKQSVTDIAKLYNVSAGSVYRWMKLNEVPTPCREVVYVDLKTNRVKEDRIKELERKVQNLERALSDKVLENCVLQGMINVAQKKYGLDLKKDWYDGVEETREVMQAIGIKASMEKVCSKFGRSKQGFYQHREYLKRRQRLLDEIIPAVKQIRADQPSVGIRKLQFHLAERDIRVGRDRLSDILREHGLESKAYRRKCTTSTGSRSNYPNLLKTFGSVQRAGEILVSDITYLSTKKGFVYLSLTSDAYSNAILGYSLERNLGSQGPLTALDQALNALGPIKVGIHHSDHGTQYTSNAFQNALSVNNILVSMTGKGKCYDNAKAERINGVLKHELYLDRNFEDYDEALLYVNHAIYIYNNERVILSKGMQRPFDILAKTAKHCG